MDYEKKYKEALERARNLHKDAIDMDENIRAKQCEIIFPELNESEDERISREITEFILTHRIDTPNDIEDTDSWLAWLEKQGGQILANSCKTCKDEPKFKDGDWIVSNEKLYVYQIEEINDFVAKVNENGVSFVVDVKCLNDAHLWTIQDAKKGDVLYCKNAGFEYIVVNKCINNQNNVDSYFMYDSLDGFDVGVPDVLSVEDDKITPATKEQRDLLFQKMKEAGYMWDYESKQLLSLKAEPSGEQKPAWSEEDDILLSSIINTLDMFEDSGASKMKIDWLKSIKQRMAQ